MKNLFNYSSYYYKLYFPQFEQIFNELKTDDFATEIIVSFEKPRLGAYLEPSFDNLQKKATKFVSKIIQQIGLDSHTHIDIPLMRSMEKLYYGSMFVGLLVNLIIFILFGLSVLLIYSLMTLTLETSKAEFGVIRLIGSSKCDIISLVICQCLLFSLPAFILAFISHYYLLSLAQLIIEKITGQIPDLRVNFEAVMFSFILTNLVPILASYLPMKSILSNDLGSCSNEKVKSSAVKVKIKSVQENERKTLIYFGCFTVVYGLGIYYFLPQSLLLKNYGTLIIIFMWILLGMMLGFILLSLNIENIIQKVCCYLLFFWTKAYIKILVLKNLTSHRIRNRSTSLMYSLSVGFFILISVGLNIELESIKMEFQKLSGVYFNIRSTFGSFQPRQLDAMLNELINKNLTQDVAFSTPPIQVLKPNLKVQLENIGKLYATNIDLVGISPNFYNTTINTFLKVNEEDKIDLPLSEKLYLENTEGGAGVSAYFKNEFGLKLNDSFVVSIKDVVSNHTISIVLKVKYFLDSSPFFEMSSHENKYKKLKRAITIPFDIYIDILNKCSDYFYSESIYNFFTPQYLNYEDLQLDSITLKVDDNMPKEKQKELEDSVRSKMNVPYRITNYFEYKEGIDKTGMLINYIFNGVSFGILVFCFFNLSSTMTINIFNQTKEIAIFRAMGMKKRSVTFILVVEAITLIFSSSIVGFLIGSILGYTMSIQRSLFTNIPAHFVFPSMQVLNILIVSVLGGFVCTIVPIRRLLSEQISDIIKKN